MEHNMKVVVVGSSNTDMILNVSKIPVPGETVLGGRFSMAAGGKGANQAVAAARAGGQVTFVARVGDDLFGRQAVEGFQADGIDTAFVRKDEAEPSGVALIFVDDAGENSIGVASGANSRLSPDDIEAAAEAFDGAAVVLTQLETPVATVEAVLDRAQKSGARVILDPAPAQPLSDALLSRVSVLTPNETEAEILSGIKVECEATARQAADALAAKGVQTVIITMGSKGAFILDQGVSRMVPAFDVEAVDSTAAGDTFSGVLATCLAAGDSMTEAVRLANAAAAMSVTVHGAQPSAPDREAIVKFMQSN
jgi:ribokinase